MDVSGGVERRWLLSRSMTTIKTQLSLNNLTTLGDWVSSPANSTEPRTPAHLSGTSLPRSRAEHERVVSATVLAPRDLAIPYSGSQRLTNEPEVFRQWSELFGSFENLSREISLSSLKNHARTHTDGDHHNKVR